MCGIVGYAGVKPALPLLMQGLERLEYRGYDAAGVAVHDGVRLRTVKAVGEVKRLKEKLSGMALPGTVGLAHTRWTTHGSPYTEENAHPHSDPTGRVVLVHNGTLDNDVELRQELLARGAVFSSETDTELIAHLLAEELAVTPDGDRLEALAATLRRLHGTYGLVVLCADRPDELLVARFGSPMAIGFGQDGVVVASDASPMIGHAARVRYLEDGEIARVSATAFEIRSLDGAASPDTSLPLDATVEEAQKGGHPHFMLAEILDQGHAVRRVLRGRLDADDGNTTFPELAAHEERLRGISRAVILACGSSYYSGQLAEQYIEELAGIPVETEIASEFRYRTPPISADTLVIVISQSGETMDTMLAMREAKKRGAFVLAIVNKVGTSIPRDADATVYTHAGPETGVASTKAFLTQCVALLLLAVHLGRARSLPFARGMELVAEIEGLPEQVEKMLLSRGRMVQIAARHLGAKHFLFLGRRYSVPVVMEGALKLKEISYAHAEGYPAGEMKHGPLAMLDEDFPCVLLVPKDSVYEKTRNNAKELGSRSIPLIVLTTEGNTDFTPMAGVKNDIATPDVLFLPPASDLLTPLLAVIPLQFLAYETAVMKGHDPDKPRNLAKTVVVE